MRILFTRFPLESAFGGAEVQTLALMKGLRSRGHDVEFLGSCPILLREARCSRFEIQDLQIGQPPVTKLGTLSFLWRRKNMQRALIEGVKESTAQNSRLHQRTTDGQAKLKAIFMLSLTEKLLLTEWASARGIRVFWIEHDRIGRWLTRNPWLPTLRRLSTPATTITVSDLSRNLYLNLGWPSDRTIAIPNGIDLDRLKSPSASHSTNPHTPSSLHLGCIARLSPEKGVDLLIEAVLDLPEVTLDIIGHGREEGFLRNLAARAGDRIRICPHVSDLGAFYRSLDCLVLPSRDHDPFGLTAAEAMSVGVPVIVTDQCGIASSLTSGKDAFIVQANSTGALKEAMQSMLDPRLRTRLSVDGKETAEKKFSMEKMIDRYEEVLLRFHSP